eukprot:10471439-Ditylum_brightwellii.AAC.1
MHHSNEEEEDAIPKNAKENPETQHPYPHPNHHHSDDTDDIYNYYLHTLIPALTSSLPILCYKLVQD